MNTAPIQAINKSVDVSQAKSTKRCNDGKSKPIKIPVQAINENVVQSSTIGKHTTVDENIIGALKIQIHYNSIQILIFAIML